MSKRGRGPGRPPRPVVNTRTDEGSVWILGLLHSGTTIFWRAWRKDDRFLCFDEPFLPLARLPLDNEKATRAELIALFERVPDPRLFWRRHAPLRPLEELDSSFTSGQIEWLRCLLAQAPKVVIDETHLHLHLPALAEHTPDAHLIHLYRRARGFVTSHLRPSWSRDAPWWRRGVRRLRREYQKRVFWTREDFPPGLRRDDVIGRHPHSKFGLMLADAGYDAERIMASPAIVRLLAYWHYHYHHLEQQGPRLFGERYTQVRYEDFAREPASVMRDLYEWVDMPPPEPLAYPDVYEPKPPFRSEDRRWRDAARIAGFDEDEIETLL